jgi:glycosyltransferase involved in cell wall biosynthesis
MVVAINTRLLLQDKLEGIGWFTLETLKRITRDHPEHQFVFIFDRPYSSSFIFSNNILPVVVPPPTRHPFLWYFWFEYQIPRILKKFKADVFISPDGYLSLRTDVPQVPVIHDINFVHRPGDLPWLTSRYYNRYFPKFAVKARRIATVSCYSKEDIASSFHVNRNKIDVVYDGINPIFTPTTGEAQKTTRGKYSQGKEYFLYVGALHPRKNIKGLLKAFDAFRSRDKKECKLLIVGGNMFKTGEIYHTYKNMQFREDVLFTGRVSTKELHQILGAALALVFVPFFEGFGIPVVESMSTGTPVICSSTTSLPEVGGNAVLYADPNQTDQITDAMIAVAENQNIRDDLIKKGFRQKEKFSWEETARKLWLCLEKAIN